MPGRWTQDEFDDLARMYPNSMISPEQLMQHFGRPWSGIQRQAKLYKLHRRETERWTEKEVQDLKRLYIDEDIPAEMIMQHFGRSWRSITGKAFTLKLRRPKPNPCGAVRDYFHTIDSDEKAYWLGFIAADGTVCITGRQHVVRIDLQPRDLHWLERFRDTVAPGMKITKHKERSYSVGIGSQEMVNDLIALGIRPRKSWSLEWPNVPEAFVMPFLLGYFDGDGSFRPRKGRRDYQWIMIGTKALLTTARIYLQHHTGVELKEPVRHCKNRCEHLYRISANGPRAPMIDRVLNASGLGLPRKHLRSDINQPED
jgi:hypothetical protein